MQKRESVERNTPQYDGVFDAWVGRITGGRYRVKTTHEPTIVTWGVGTRFPKPPVTRRIVRGN